MSDLIEIGIVDTRNVVKTISEVYDFDLTNYALTSLKRRFERIIVLHNLRNADGLIKKIKNTPDYYDKFIRDFSVQATEMFRDPSLWRWLRDNYLPDIMKLDSSYRIWLPDCVSGDELYTLCILLKESNLLNNIQIIVSCISESHIENIKTGKCAIKKIEVSVENYKRFNATGNFNEYYTTDEYFALRDQTLIENVEFQKINIHRDKVPRLVDMIVFRNHFVYFNQTLQDEITNKLMSSLKIGGAFIIGNKEVLGRQFLNDFVFINHAESVFKKR